MIEETKVEISETSPSQTPVEELSLLKTSKDKPLSPQVESSSSTGTQSLGLTQLYGQQHIVYSIQILADLLSTLNNSSKRDNKKIIHVFAQVMKRSNDLIEFFNIDPLSTDEIEDYGRNVIPAEVQIDVILSVTEMISALIDIMHITNVIDNPPVWGEEEVPEDLEIDFLSIHSCIYNVGRKLKFKYEDIVDETYRLK